MNKQHVFAAHHKRVNILAVSFIFSISSLAQAAVIDLGEAGGFNAFILGDMSASRSDIEGRLAVGGNLNINDYSIGMELDNSWNNKDTLAVGGNLNFSNGRVYHGNSRSGGTATFGTDSNGYSTVGYYSSDNPSQSNGSHIPGNNVDFAGLSQDLKNKSSIWGAMASTGNTEVSASNEIKLSGSQELNVFSVSGSDLSSASSFTLDIPTTSWALINVSGTNISMSDFGFYHTGYNLFDQNNKLIQLPDNKPASSESDEIRHDGSFTQRVLFNLVDATSLTLNAIGIKGSLLAPLAETDFYNGQIDGNLILGSWNAVADGQNSGQVNLYPFIPTSTGVSSVPVPSVLPIIVIALGGLFNLSRRAKLKA